MPMIQIAEFERPTPERIAWLFRAKDIIPSQHHYLLPDNPDGTCVACAVGVLLVDIRGGVERAEEYRGGRERECFVDVLAEATGWPVDFVAGIDDGFTSATSDGDMEGRRESVTASWSRCGSIEQPGLYRENFAIGWRAWELVKAGEAH
jgi:hypothetical protein